MAEERNLALPRAQAPDDEDATKEQLQRRMEEARESITQTVSEIKETVATQYQNVRDALDWREHYRRRPLAFSLSALGVGFLAGYGFGHLIVGGGSESRRYPLYEEDYDEGDGRAAARSYAALAPAVTASERTSAPRAPQADSSERVSHAPSAGGILDVGPNSSPSSYATGGEIASTTASEPDKPGLMERFKETRAYDRLQTEVSTIGDRVLEELSRTAQTVVLPALFNKIKEMIGVDLSRQQAGGGSSSTGAQQSGGGRGQQQQQSAATGAAGAGGGSQASGMNAGGDASGAQATGGASQSARAGGSATGGGTSYGTSENKGYGSSSS